MTNTSNNTAKANTATGATVSADNAAQANIAALPYDPANGDGPAYKYSAGAANVPCATRRFRLTAAGAAMAASGGLGKSGKVTIMGLVTLAAKAAGATAKAPVTGLAIVAQMRGLPDVAALYRASKAGKYAPKGALPCPQWCSDYVTGAARSVPGLLAAVSA